MKKLVPNLLVCCQILLLVHVQSAWTQEKIIEQADQTDRSASQETENKKKELKTQLIELSGIIKLQQKILGDLQSKLDQNPTELTKVALEGQISESEQILKNAQTAFESIVTGGLDLENFQEMPDQSFDWQSDLIEIIQPIFQSLKDLTEQPRAMERIRKTIEFYQQNLVEINDSIQKIQEWQSEQIVDLSARQQIKAIEESWLLRKSEAQRNLELFQLQLSNLQIQQESIWSSVWTAFGAFLTGRGLNLML
ncbi:MAG: hypothetical protein VXW41_07920, partial [SAR324 cluster bacterium]|nr:hypothetical protein [SAR324 cluster bacterium]